MSELTLTIMRLGLLALLWLFIFAVVGVLRSDLYGTRVLNRSARKTAPAERTAKPTRADKKANRRNARMPTHLTVTGGPLTGSSLPLKESGTLIGRNPECALVLDDDYASGRHVRIYRDDSGWMVEDLGSTNGTYLGQSRLTDPTPVEVGSELRIGKTVVELRR